jgi:hypothetical protein
MGVCSWHAVLGGVSIDIWDGWKGEMGEGDVLGDSDSDHCRAPY